MPSIQSDLGKGVSTRLYELKRAYESRTQELRYFCGSAADLVSRSRDSQIPNQIKRKFGYPLVGAQAVSSFDTLLAPFIRKDNLEYKQVEQNVQQFVFGLNVASRLGQCVPMSTKCLKADGTWVNGNELQIGDEIVVYDIDQRELKTDFVTHITNKPYKGKIHNYTEGSLYKFQVTPDHLVLYYGVEEGVVGMKYTESQNLLDRGKDVCIPEMNVYKETGLRWCSISEEDFDGQVWCPTTNTGTFVGMSEEGSVFITHNCPFTNITLDWTVPEDLKDTPVIIDGKPHDTWLYKDFQPEMDMINKAFLTVMARGDEEGRIFTFPIPTYNITRDFNWDSENAKLLFEVTGKYGMPYFQNFINSELQPSDVRSMALIGNQELIYKRSDGRITKSAIRKMVENWKAQENPQYKVLMNGRFINIIDMFEVPYDKYQSYIKITLQNGYEQIFSEQHKCLVERNGETQIIESQDIISGDNLLLSNKPWNIHNNIGTKQSGRIVGYYLAEGWMNSHSRNEIVFAININREDIVNEITMFFQALGCEVKATRYDNTHIYSVNVYGTAATGLVTQYISGKKATEKKFEIALWNASDEFRQGLLEGYCDTDGCPTHNIIAHTTNKALIEDLITLGASLGRIFYYRVNDKNTRSFKSDKSDKVTFTSYELVERTLNTTDGFIRMPVRSVITQPKRSNVVYNFTVDTPDHLFELPNGLITHQCCRLQLDLRSLAKKTGGLFGSGEQTGSIGVVTINMPRLGYLYKDKEELKKQLYRLMTLAKDSLEIKRKLADDNFNRGLMPYSRIYLPSFKHHFSTIGLVGMNELCLNFLGKNIASPEGKALAEELLEFMRDTLKDFQEKTGNIYNLESSPAEGTSFRLAKIDKEEYPDIITAGSETPYYTNSSNLPVGYTADMFEALDLQEKLQCCYTGGTVFHGFIGERIDDPALVARIVKTIAENYRIPYFTITPTFSICPVHGYIPGEHSKCPLEE